MSNDYDHKFQILLIGESGVGKTCLIQRFVNGDFLVNHLATIAIDFKKTIVEISKKKINLQIWDTAGQERFNNLTKGFFKTANGIILTYSINDQKSFLAINKWMKQIYNNAPKNIKISIVANKCDLDDQQRVVPMDEGKKCSEEYGTSFFEVSAFNGENVNEVFEDLGKRILKDFEDVDHGVKLSGIRKKKRKCC